jgi:hypothetical protein
VVPGEDVGCRGYAAGVHQAESAEDQHDQCGDERGDRGIPAIAPMVPKAQALSSSPRRVSPLNMWQRYP